MWKTKERRERDYEDSSCPSFCSLKPTDNDNHIFLRARTKLVYSQYLPKQIKVCNLQVNWIKVFIP